MSLHSPKRRKLDHDSDDSADLHDANHGLLKDTTKTVPDAKEQPKSKTETTVADSTAMYSGNDYKSSMFKLQVDEMLSEIRPNYSKRMQSINEALHTLKIAIESIDDREAVTIPEAIKFLRKTKIVIPFPNPKPDPNAAYKLSYASPSNINVVGSYALQTMIKDTELVVDMVVAMPISIFQEKDYLNYRYFYKRAYYLACIAAGLAKSGFDTKYELLDGNELQPILVVRPVKGSSNDFSPSKSIIHIIPSAPEGFFSEAKLRPNKNCIRPAAASDGEITAPLATPFYNATIRAEGSYGQYLKLLHLCSKQADGFKEACILGRVWLRQRGFGSSLAKGGFGSFEWSAMMALLLQGGSVKGHSVLSAGYSSYQLFKATIQYIASTNFNLKSAVFQAPGVELSRSESPVFYDGPRGTNVLYKMTPSSYAALREEAKLSLEALNDSMFDQFEATFILKKDHAMYQFDCIFSIHGSPLASASTSQDHLAKIQRLDSKAYEVLKEGLGDRVKEVRLFNGSCLPSWSLNAAQPVVSPSLTVGLVFEPANIDRVVDHGPAAEEKKKAARFQKFWGDKAELRRFKDGSILESLVWSGAESGSVHKEIITYIIKRHVGGAVAFVNDDLMQQLPGSDSSKNFIALREAYRKFSQDVRGLEKLPLQLRQLSPVGPELRDALVRPPVFSERHILRQPASVVIQFEGSGRWPDDVVAIQRTKAAFLLRIGELLEASVEGLQTKLGLENTEQALGNCAFLDVLYANGAVFRLRIHNDREQTLLERMVKDKTLETRSREEAIIALSFYKKFYQQLPLLTQSIATQCTRFPLLSPTIRLVKRWFESHMLSGHVPEEVVELIVMRVFLQPFPWRSPSSAGTGLLRTLQFIARWDWRTTPLVVDFAGTMTSKDVGAVNTRLEAWRKIDPVMNRIALVVATNHDTTGVLFTDGKPSKVVAARMTALARSACNVVKDVQVEMSAKSLFKAALGDFDFVIHLSSKFAGLHRGKKETKEARYKNLELQTDDELPLVGYEPVELFLSELESLYGSSVIFFHDGVSNNAIAGLWSPQTGARTFKVNLGYGSKPLTAKAVEDDGADAKVGIDKSAMLSEISRLGGDLISRIEVNR